MTQMNEHGKIEGMSLEERTTQYTTKRSAELRGERIVPWLDDCTKRYICRRLAELRGDRSPEDRNDEHPYIKRRLAEIRARSK